MNWNNLLKNRCPKCKLILWFDKDEEMIICPNISCGFMIKQKRMEMICIDLVNEKFINESECVDNSD